jgi:hypothetical protein
MQRNPWNVGNFFDFFLLFFLCDGNPFNKSSRTRTSRSLLAKKSNSYNQRAQSFATPQKQKQQRGATTRALEQSKLTAHPN